MHSEFAWHSHGFVGICCAFLDMNARVLPGTRERANTGYGRNRSFPLNPTPAQRIQRSDPYPGRCLGCMNARICTMHIGHITDDRKYDNISVSGQTIRQLDPRSVGVRPLPSIACRRCGSGMARTRVVPVTSARTSRSARASFWRQSTRLDIPSWIP